MALQKKTLKDNEVSTTIDLEELLGAAAKNSAIREVFFQAAFDKLMERLDQGRGVNGELHGYSKAYKDSLEFKAFGKSSTVNMQLTGDMVNSISPLEVNSKRMIIGFEGSENNAKAYAHITGFKGHPTLQGKVKPRNFFGWKDNELEKIADSIKPEINDDSIISDERVLGVLERLLSG